MTSPGLLLAALITLLLVGAVLQIIVALFTHRDEQLGAKRGEVDGDVVFRDDRVNELLYTGPGGEEPELDFDPSEVETVTCSECRTLNDAAYTFCRNCSAKLADA